MCVGAVLPAFMMAGTVLGQDNSKLLTERLLIQSVLVNGQHVSGLPDTIRDILSIDTNDRCVLAVRATMLAAPPSDNVREMVLVGPRGHVSIAAIANTAVVGQHAMTYGPSFSNVCVGGNLDLSFENAASAGGASVTTLFSMPAPGAPATVDGRIGTTIVGLDPTITASTLMPQQQGPTPYMSWLARLTGPGVTTATDLALVGGYPHSQHLIVREGIPIVSLGNAKLTPNDNPTTVTTWFGGLVFAATRTNVNGTTAQGLYTAEPISPVVETGNTPIGLPGTMFAQLAAPVGIGYGGTIAFTARLSGQGVSDPNASVIWRNTSPRLVARGAQHAFGEPEGVVFSRFSVPVVYGQQSAVGFMASLSGRGVTGDNDTGLYALDHEPRKIAREGDQAPGLPEGVRFGSFDATLSRTPVFFNTRGDAVFMVSITGPGVTQANNQVLVSWEHDRGLRLLVRLGAPISYHVITSTVTSMQLPLAQVEGAPGITSGEDGRRTAFNRYGEAFVVLTLSNGTKGLFMTQVGNVPCAADFNADEALDLFDYNDFVIAFQAGHPDADFNLDGTIDFFDYDAFVRAFEAPC